MLSVFPHEGIMRKNGTKVPFVAKWQQTERTAVCCEVTWNLMCSTLPHNGPSVPLWGSWLSIQQAKPTVSTDFVFPVGTAGKAYCTDRENVRKLKFV